ncbi:MAG: type II toxin-antitoxin system VapC family toxin [Verrucomicrobiota bacterium]
MKQVVADASFCGAWILADESSDIAEQLLSLIVRGKVELVVPALWHYEMNNLLRSAHKRRRLSEEDAREALETLNQVPLTIEDLPEGPARKRILHLALQFDLFSYDAAYLELADRHKIPLHSADAKLNAAAKQLGLAPK